MLDKSCRKPTLRASARCPRLRDLSPFVGGKVLLLLGGLLYGCGTGGDTGEIEMEASERFELTFEATWSKATHEADFPSGAHFSDLIGAVHHDSVFLWESGSTASPGVEQMAETGGTSTLSREVNTLIEGKSAFAVVSGDGIASSPGSTTIVIEAIDDYPFVSLTTMVAPSPDWFVGVDRLSLKNLDGSWIDTMTVELRVYDAGTDSGELYTSPNKDSRPKELIQRKTGGVFDIPFATLTIKRL